MPAYRTYVQTSERTAAEADLLELAQFMERRFSQGFDYTDGGAAPALPFTRTPRQSAAGSESYQLGFQGNVTRNTFTLQAVPVNAQAGEPCGTLIIDNLGNRTSSGSGQGCW
ncbi:MAG: pilus assembly protein PilE [Marinobacter sp.]|nr:pilus assembly protein PilE [Marinobacter sp.]